jgi:hypothetical protein
MSSHKLHRPLTGFIEKRYSIEQVLSLASKKLRRENAPLREKLLNKKFYEFTYRYQSHFYEKRPSICVSREMDFRPIEDAILEEEEEEEESTMPIFRTISVEFN